MDKARADFIIGELARKPGERPLVILMTSTHPMTDRNLCRTGHQFYNLDLPQFPIKWQNEEQVPENMHIIKSINELPHRPDLIISQNIVDQYNVWVQFAGLFDCPIVSFEHTLPTDDWLKQGVVDKIREDLQPVQRVFITDFSRVEWKCGEDENAHTLYHMVDTDKFSKWEGGNGKAMMMVNSFVGREWAVGDIDALLAHDVATAPHGQDVNGNPEIQPRFRLFGVNPGYVSQPIRGQQVVQQLREHDVFVNASVKSPIPASLLEAASVGMPIVTTDTCAIPRFFEDGVNCLIYDGTPEDCMKKVDQLMGDRKLRKKLGAAARETVLKHFNQSRYEDDWNAIFNTTMEKFNG